MTGDRSALGWDGKRAGRLRRGTKSLRPVESIFAPLRDEMRQVESKNGPRRDLTGAAFCGTLKYGLRAASTGVETRPRMVPNPPPGATSF